MNWLKRLFGCESEPVAAEYAGPIGMGFTPPDVPLPEIREADAGLPIHRYCDECGRLAIYYKRRVNRESFLIDFRGGGVTDRWSEPRWLCFACVVTFDDDVAAARKAQGAA